MRIYRVSVSSHNNLILTASPSGWDKLWDAVRQAFDLSHWDPVRIYKGKKNKATIRPCDFVVLGDYLVCNDNTKDILVNLLGDKLLMYQLFYEDADYWLVVLQNELDTLDFKRLIFSPIKHSTKILISRYSFIESELTNELLFSVPQRGRIDTYATERFKQIVEEEYNLTGLKFELLWDSEALASKSAGETSNE